MKITAIIILSTAITASATGHSQTVTLDLKKAPIEKVFNEVSKQTGFSFMYGESMFKEFSPVTIKVKDATVNEVLQKCFNGQPFNYRVEGNAIVISKRGNTVIDSDNEPGSPVSLIPPPIDVRGRILNENGEPVLASIVVKGGNKGTTTNAEGYFELKGVDANATLVITGISINTQEIKLNGRSDVVINTTMKVTAAQEVIINKGYYSTSRKLNTGNVSKVNAVDIEKQPTSNLLLTLQGRVPGLIVQQTNGIAGGSVSVQLRGQNSIASGNSPLYIIDGVPFITNSIASGYVNNNIIPGANPLNTINTFDIESVEILKDADATSIYGSRGANGVILITTKKGAAGKTRFDINFYTGFGKAARKMDLLDTKEYLEVRREAFKNDGIIPTPQNSFFPELFDWDTTRNKDWQKEFFGNTSNIINAQSSISGGNNNIQYLAGGSYHRETTVLPGSFYNERGTFHLNLNSSSENRKFNFNFFTNFGIENTTLPRSDIAGYALFLPPNTPELIDSNGKLNWATSSNPLYFLYQKYKAKAQNLVANTTLNYKIIPDLGFKVNLGFNNVSRDEKQTNPKSSIDPSSNTLANSYFSNRKVTTWIVEPQANWAKNFGLHKINILIGSSLQESQSDGQSLYATGFSSDALLEDIRAASTVSVQNTNLSQYRYTSIFARLNYNLSDKYLINLVGRRDGSSRFGPGKKFGNFGSIGIGWLFSEEKNFQKAINFISYGKIRGSIGISGNDQIGDYQYLSNYGSSNPYQNSNALNPIRLLNPDFAWEQNKRIELAMELGLFSDKIFIEASYYRNRSNDQLIGYSLPPTTGFQSILFNLPANVQNTGAEISVSTNNIERKHFKWSTNFNISFPRNKLVEFPNLKSYSSYVNIYEIGKPLNVVKAFHYIGINPTNGTYAFQDVDQNGSGTNYPNDLQSSKNLAPVFYGGLSNSVKFKRLEFDIFFQFVKQTGLNYMMAFDAPGTYGNQPNLVLNRWQKPGDHPTVQKYTQGGGSGEAYLAYTNSRTYGDNRIGDASFIRLKNLSLSYKFSRSTKGERLFQNCKVFLQGQNLITITNYLGLDPESQTVATPPLKILVAGFQITF